jgi:hypothetical protein
MQQIEIDFNRAATLRDDGMLRAELGADLANDRWSESALDAVIGYARTHRGVEFMAERVRDWAYQLGMVRVVRNGRAWGQVMIRAAKMGIIRKVGYGLTENVNAHRTPAAKWVAV